MRLVLACVGRLKAGAERDLVTRYVDRIRPAGRPLGLGPCDMIEIAESAARRAEDRMAEEGAALLAALPVGAGLMVLDPRGRQVSSEDFAARMAAQRDGGLPALAFAIGGADGLSDAVREKATLMVAYGTATFPHQLVRVMLAEQIYRAVTILSGHPYHRA
ncbi:23S rRNA (pseudouridine(1915)-N(3))-methyltransferase RlmH [Xanthobacter autotrophicus]|uniref:23S rRNA (pseudouridine(1915)-N(3))-methyltransferase RlmH n=1 Tax=Xanthobacter TaxID=279 RepID=UPI0024AAEA1D|nr:23S rRNA (pseudouridine(1915)-N(3))-methyltransferase RlmH [Xanthobacter autotrophicus]MDI4664054.1 23S rRNA (pseudouridine(1915)-N(3))-methyltransferase RlmH [Xanthobacter autotrophicus]